MPVAVVKRAHAAMGTRFEVILAGEDAEHLDAVCTLVCEEIDRAERLLSRFDPASETFRVNREAVAAAVRISPELVAVLQQCQAWFHKTAGAFAVVAKNSGERVGWQAVVLNAQRRTLRLETPDIHLDFGGYGKGYALDRAGELLRQHGVESAFLHGGTSSIFTIGTDQHGEPWRVDVGLPNAWQTITLTSSTSALSTSATTDEQDTPGETFDPHTGERLTGRKSCTAIAASAAIAEIVSTAMLVLGPTGQRLLEHWPTTSEAAIERVIWNTESQGGIATTAWSRNDEQGK